jgi:hypothetical protein
MRARAGDTLRTGSGTTAIIVTVIGSDGQPPYVVRWASDGHIAMVNPDQYARIIRASQQPGPADLAVSET